MKHVLVMLPLLLSACATLTGESDQLITVATVPPGASCTLANKDSSNTIQQTPGSAAIARSYSPLTVACRLGNLAGTQTLEPSTRGRAYANMLMLGVPAVVDAATGKGYEYDPENLTIPLQ